MKNLKGTQENVATDLHYIKDQLTKVNLDLETQKRRNIRLQTQSKRSNIKFFNVPESETQGYRKGAETSPSKRAKNV